MPFVIVPKGLEQGHGTQDVCMIQQVSPACIQPLRPVLRLHMVHSSDNITQRTLGVQLNNFVIHCKLDIPTMLVRMLLYAILCIEGVLFKLLKSVVPDSVSGFNDKLISHIWVYVQCKVNTKSLEWGLVNGCVTSCVIRAFQPMVVTTTILKYYPLQRSNGIV